MSETLSRREFTEALAALVALLPFGARPAAAAPAAGSGATAVAAAATGAAEPEVEALARAYVDAVKAEFGDRLDDAALAEILKQVQANLRRAARIRALPLDYAAEPDVVFTPAGAPR